MQKILIYICLFSQSIAFGQQQTKGFSNFFIGGSICKTSVIFINDNYILPTNSTTTIRHKISGNQSYAVSSGVDFALSSTYQIRFQGEYERLRYNEDLTGLWFSSDINASTGVITNSVFRKIYTLNNLNTQLLLLRSHGKNKRFYTGFGVATHFKFHEYSESKILYGNGDVEYFKSDASAIDKSKIDDVSLEILEGYHLIANESIQFSFQPFIQLRLKRRTIDDFGSTGHKLNYGIKAIVGFSPSKKSAKCYKF
jgi:hypothetical protein